MRVLGNLTFAGLGQVQNLRVENLAQDPASPSVGQVWYNTAEGVYKGFDGTSIVTFASGGNTQLIVDEVNAIETAAGLEADGTYAPQVGTNYIDGAATLKAADALLDAQAKLNATAISALQTSSGDLTAEVNAIETAAGLNADGTYTADATANYIGGATSLANADKLLDAQAKLNADAAAAAQATADLKVAKAGDSMTGDLAFQGTHKVIGLADPTDSRDAVNKAYVDNLLAGLTWEAPVDAIATALPSDTAGLQAGYRVANSTDNKIYTFDGAAFNSGEALVDGAAFFDRSNETGYVYSGVEIVQFTGGGQLTAGVGLAKNGNVIDVNLGAGIAQLPTDEVGIDVLTSGGLMLTVDGTTDSTDTAAQLAVRLDGATLARSNAGVKVAAQGVTAVELNTSVAGNGITGGNGTALAVVADTGIAVSATGVALDTTFADARYINVDGDTMTGALVLAADPAAALEAATKQYVDAVRTALQNSTYVYDGSVANASHTVTHNIGSQFCNVTVVDSANKVILPDSITFDSANQLTVAFSSAITCKVIVTGNYVAA